MGVKETPISENPEEAEIQEGPEEKEEQEEKEEEEKEKKEEKEEESQIVAKPKKTRAKPKQEKAAKPAKAKPAAKPAKKAEDPKTMCHVCTTPMTNDALLSHSCSKKALENRKQAPVFEEVPPQPPLERQPLSYREIVAREQAEYRRQKAARIVNPIRAHFFGRI